MSPTAPPGDVNVACQLNPNLMTRIAGPNAVHLYGIATPVEVSLSLLGVLSAFADRKTPREVFGTLDVEGDLAEFGELVSGLLEKDVLVREQKAATTGPSLGDVLKPRLFSDPAMSRKIATWMQEGRAVVIPDALPQEFAERVHRDLDDADGWRTTEGARDFFHFRTYTVDDLAHRSGALGECHKLFGSPDTRGFLSRLSGRDCSADASVGGTWYRPGDYALPHEDTHPTVRRSVAYIWYLTKRWRHEWGGSLFWCRTGQYLQPAFNSLIVFNVSRENFHVVCPVAPTATEKRLAVSGFWHAAEPPGERTKVPADAVVSERAYGPTPPEGLDSAQLLVL